MTSKSFFEHMSVLLGYSYVHPFAILKDDLKHENLAIRINGIKNLPKVAHSLGAERTRRELIPFLTEELYDDDEVLIALSRQLGQFTPYVGGRDHVYSILPLLENLATVEGTEVRLEAEKSLKNICAQQSAEDLEKHFLPVIERMCGGIWYMSRESVCGLICACYERFPDAVKSVLRSRFCNLCEDDTPMVRQAAASKLGEFAKVIEPEFVKSKLIPILTKLVQDDQESVRLVAVEARAIIATLLPTEDVDKLTTVVKCQVSEDKS